MKIGPFQYKNVEDEDVAEALLSVRDIVDQINKAPFMSDNVIRRFLPVTTQPAADERPVLIIPGDFASVVLERAAFSLRANLAAGTIFTLKRYTSSTNISIATYDTTTNGATTAYTQKLMTLADKAKLVLNANDVLTLAITGNVPTEGILTLTLNEVFP